MENALLGDDGADQKRDEHDDRHRAPADALEMMHDRRQPKPPGRDDRRAAPTSVTRAEHVDDRRTSDQPISATPRPTDPSAPEMRFGRRGVAGRRALTRRTSSIRLRIGAERPTMRARRTARRQAAVQPLDQPGAESVEPLQSREVDIDAARTLPWRRAASSTICSSSAACSAVQAPEAQAPGVGPGRCTVSQRALMAFYPLLARAPMAALERPGQARS